MEERLEVGAERIQTVFRRVDEGVGNACQTETLDVVVPERQLILAAGSAEDVQVERLNIVHVDVADVFGRGQEQCFDLLQRPPVLQETDPAGPALEIRCPAKKAEVKLIDDSAERFGGVQDGAGNKDLALGAEGIDPRVELGWPGRSAKELVVERLHESEARTQTAVDVDAPHDSRQDAVGKDVVLGKDGAVSRVGQNDRGVEDVDRARKTTKIIGSQAPQITASQIDGAAVRAVAKHAHTTIVIVK